MVVSYFYVVGVLSVPSKTYAVLLIYPYAMLPDPVAFQGFKSVARRKAQFVEV
jgi:hypothetical protein